MKKREGRLGWTMEDVAWVWLLWERCPLWVKSKADRWWWWARRKAARVMDLWVALPARIATTNMVGQEMRCRKKGESRAEDSRGENGQWVAGRMEARMNGQMDGRRRSGGEQGEISSGTPSVTVIFIERREAD